MPAMLPVLAGAALLGAGALMFSKKSSGGARAAAPEPDMPLTLKQQMATILRGLNVDPETGSIQGQPSAASVQAATLFASTLESQGYVSPAASVRAFAQAAAQFVDEPPAITPSAAMALPSDLIATVNKALQMESDPAVLRDLAAELRALPNASDPQIQLLIGALEQKAANAESHMVVANTAIQIETILSTPPATKPPAAPPMSDVRKAAEDMVSNLKSVQNKYGFPGCKGKENKDLVKKFQLLAGQSADGMVGPGTLVEVARTGLCSLPKVMYWPKGSSAQKVYLYRDALRAMGTALGGDCKNTLDQSATAEMGQGGISGTVK